MTEQPQPLVSMAERFIAHGSSAETALLWEDRRVGFAELVDRADRMLGFLVQEGVTPGAVVGISIGDEQLHLAVAIALLAHGAPQVCLPGHETPDSNRSTVERLGVSIIVADRPIPWRGDARLIRIGPGVSRPAGGFAHAVSPAPEAPAIYVKTSGSTAAPKLFALSFARLMDGAARCAADPASRCVMRTSTVEFDSTRLQRLFAIIAGRRSAFAPRDTSDLGAVCGRLGVTQAHFGAYALASLTRADRPPGRLPAQTSILTGGSRVPGPLRAEVAERLTRELYVSYATSEVGPISTALPDEHAAFPEGVGRPRADALVEIVDDDGRSLPRGQTGEIRVRRPAAPRAYVGEPSEQFRDGWFYPRDLVSWPEGGPLIHHGRADDVMLLNGVKISGEAIEDALCAHPAVREAVAYPIRSRLHGEIPAVAVTLRPSAGEAPGSDALLAHCRGLLGMRSARRVVVVDAIPRTATGKPIRRALAEL